VLSWYPAGKPFTVLTGPTAASLPAFFVMTVVAAIAFVAASTGNASAHSAATARLPSRRRRACPLVSSTERETAAPGAPVHPKNFIGAPVESQESPTPEAAP